jgi:uncharacterized protein YcnI
MKFRHALTAAAAALLIAVPAANAHITMKSDNTSAGGYAYVTFHVPHGCEESPTTKVELQLPEGVTSFVPERSPFWKVDVATKQPSDDMKSQDGKAITEVPDVVTWTAITPLPHDQLDVLGASVKLPDTEGQVNFPLVQTCAKGSPSWTEIQADGADEPEHPAPSLTLTAGGEDDHHMAKADDDAADDSDGDAAASSSKVKDLQDDVDQARTFAIVGIALGAIGLLFGLIAVRRRKP